LTTSSPLTVLTNQRSVFGPKTASKLFRCSSGQRPPTRLAAPCSRASVKALMSSTYCDGCALALLERLDNSGQCRRLPQDRQRAGFAWDRGTSARWLPRSLLTAP